MRTKQEMKPVIEAWLNDKEIEVRLVGKEGRWCPRWCSPIGSPIPNFFEEGLEWRIKPEKKLRPWKPEEVPVGAMFRPKSSGRSWVMQIAGINWAYSDGAKIYFNGGSTTPQRIFEMDEHSTDGGKTWHPCGVEE